ncbi:MAG: hypothetical protein WAW96_17210 [Alphaproteobacteria bacterium]
MLLTIAAIFTREILVRVALVALLCWAVAPLAFAANPAAAEEIGWCTSHGLVVAAARFDSAAPKLPTDRPRPLDLCFHATCSAAGRLRARNLSTA